jgi:gluconolactonase
MKPLLSILSLLTVAVMAAPVAPPSIEKLDASLTQLLAEDAKIEKIATGFGWSEGPVWWKDRLVFSDVPNNTAYVWKEGDANASVFLKPSGTDEPSTLQGSNGLAVDAQGHLILCQHGARRIAQLQDDGKFRPLATAYNGQRFSSPNDLCIAKDGTVYFTDPPYGLPKGVKPETDFHGVYKRSPQGEVSLVTKAVLWPNGIALSLDEKFLYLAVSDNDNPRIAACNLDGSNLRDIFLALPLKKKTNRPGNPDGMKLDVQGNIWTTGPGGVLILTPEGKHLGTILLNQPTANLAWGNDGHTLYITSNHDLFRVKTLVKGAGF